MTRDSQPPRNNKPSLKYRRSPLEGAYFEFTDFKYVDYTPTPSGNCKRNGRKSEPKPAEILHTSELVSAVGQIWECANRSLTFPQPKTKSRHSEVGFQEVNVFCHSGGKGNAKSSNSAEVQYFPVDTMTNCHSPIIQANIGFLKVSKKISFFEPHSGNYTHSLLRKVVQGGSKIPYESWKEKCPATAGVLYDLRNVYGWMSEMSLAGLKHQVNSIQIETKKTSEYCLSGDSSPRSSCNFGDTTIPADIPTAESADSHTQITKCVDPSSGQSTSVAKASATSLWSDYYRTEITKHEDSSSCQSTSVAKPCITSLWYESKKNQQTEFVLADKSNKPHYGLAKREHAFAGALAGIFVSLCLHPVDTVKTVIQSCHADQRSIRYIGRSIISERGVTGLYRGIASNIASSAPISAVYTFTYESVKGSLLPFLPKEYQSFAHCISGGCASIASSFIFTPSERIKQQMQVGTHYQNCWKALAGIIKKGGLGSLYAGWGAVLCRNVPHSIIKFYIYESMKRWMLSSLESNAQPNTLQTLICGGLAGSTAALFTTPFDVVKTRLQTQIPGSSHQYDGVFNTLKEISMREGLKGLYRGLIPRLFMYISQGAIFFASYESFKRLFSLEAPHLHAQTIGYIQNMKDETQ